MNMEAIVREQQLERKDKNLSFDLHIWKTWLPTDGRKAKILNFEC